MKNISISRFFSDTRAHSTVEFMVMLGVVISIGVGGLTQLASKMHGVYNSTNNSFNQTANNNVQIDNENSIYRSD